MYVWRFAYAEEVKTCHDITKKMRQQQQQMRSICDVFCIPYSRTTTMLMLCLCILDQQERKKTPKPQPEKEN